MVIKDMTVPQGTLMQIYKLLKSGDATLSDCIAPLMAERVLQLPVDSQQLQALQLAAAAAKEAGAGFALPAPGPQLLATGLSIR